MSIVARGLDGLQDVRYSATGQTLYCWAEVDGAKVTPTGTPTVSIFQPGSETALLSAQAVTVDGTTAQMSYVLNASNTTNYYLTEGYRAEFSFVSGGLTYIRRINFDVVRTPILHLCPVRIDDLKVAHIAVDAALTQAGAGADAHQRFIQPAWRDCLQFVKSNGWRPALTSTPDTLYSMCLYRALQKLFEGVTRKSDDLSWHLAEKYQAEYATAKEATVLKYDPGDGFNPNEERNIQQPRLLFGNDLALGGRSYSHWRTVSS